MLFRHRGPLCVKRGPLFLGIFCMRTCERCGANLALVGLRHRCVERPTVTEVSRPVTKSVTVKDRTATERQRRHREKKRLRGEWDGVCGGEFWPWPRMRGE